MINYSTHRKEIRPGYPSFLNASCTVGETKRLLDRPALPRAVVSPGFFGSRICGEKDLYMGAMSDAGCPHAFQIPLPAQSENTSAGPG